MNLAAALFTLLDSVNNILGADQCDEVSIEILGSIIFS